MSKSALDDVVINGRRTRDHYIDARYELAALRARVATLESSCRDAHQQLRATQRNLDEDCLYRCDDILSKALGDDTPRDEQPATLTPRKCRMQCIAAAEAIREACATIAETLQRPYTAMEIRALPLPPCDCNPLAAENDATTSAVCPDCGYPLEDSYALGANWCGCTSINHGADTEQDRDAGSERSAVRICSCPCGCDSFGAKQDDHGAWWCEPCYNDMMGIKQR